MPELPDVELFKRHLERHALRKPIRAVQVNDARILGNLPAARFAATLTGNRLEAARRHGKHLLVRLAREGWLTLHFGMTGGLAWFEDLADDPPYDRIRLDFATGGHLAYVNRRMLGRVGLAEDADAFIKAEDLGPDALDPAFDAAAFEAALAGRRRDLKSVLMDQALLAGIGNIYADEILFQARLHPQTPAPTMTPAQRRDLFAKLERVLETAIERGAGAEQSLERLPDGYLLPQRHKDGRCPRCGQAIATLKSAGRTSYYCPHCQPAPAR
jgi:formamidopyrimidine-DNA glycosylase